MILLCHHIARIFLQNIQISWWDLSLSYQFSWRVKSRRYMLLLISFRSLYFKWMQVYLTCCVTLLIVFWRSTWRALESDVNLYIAFWYTLSAVNIFSTSYNKLLSLYTARFLTSVAKLSFFLSYSDLFYLLLVGVQVYCCTWSHSVAHTRQDSSGRGIGPSQRTQISLN